MPKPSKPSKRKLSAIFGELKANPPAVIAKTAARKGNAAANRQRITIALFKARKGANDAKNDR